MKNQNDMIISIVAVVVALIALGVLYGTKPDPVLPKVAPDVKTAAPSLGEVQVPMVNGVGSGGQGNNQNRTAAFGGGGGNNAGGRPSFTGANSLGQGGSGAPAGPSGGGMTVNASGAAKIGG